MTTVNHGPEYTSHLSVSTFHFEQARPDMDATLVI